VIQFWKQMSPKVAMFAQSSGLKTRALALPTLGVFVTLVFALGWTRVGADFPNYYTAATLVRKGLPLQDYYDWTWFQRQMNYAGVGTHRGVYIPQTPLTMLPFIPLAAFPPQTAKRIWLGINVVLLAGTIWLLCRVTVFNLQNIALLMLCAAVPLYINFLYGQYYIALLFLLTLGYYFLRRRRSLVSGAVLGLAFALKLYAGPYLLFFMARRNWRAVAGMLAVVTCCLGLAVAMFGRANVAYYATQVIPRALEGGAVNPYHPGNPAISVILRRLFVFDPALNPHPAWNAPWLFFLLRALISIGIMAFAVLGIVNSRNVPGGRSFAWFLIAIFLVSSNTGSYVFLLLMLPVTLLLENARPRERLYLICIYILLMLYLVPIWLFPKVWLLFILFFVIGLDHWRGLKPQWIAGAAGLVALLAVADARRCMASYAKEPAQRLSRVAVEPGQFFAAFPAVNRDGVFFQMMGRDRYVLHWLHDNHIEELSFEGQALHPFTPVPNGPVWFELAAGGTSQMMRFDAASRKAFPGIPPSRTDSAELATSPDGKWVAFTSTLRGSKQIWIRNVATGEETRMTDGNCNSLSPAWELDSSAILFASDCGRALGLTALYRAPLPHTAGITRLRR
jgi:hypothetical protein